MKLNYHGIFLGFTSFEDRHCTKDELNKTSTLVKYGNSYHYNNVILDVFPCMPLALVERVKDLYLKVHQLQFCKGHGISKTFAFIVVIEWKGYNVNSCLFAWDPITGSQMHPWKSLTKWKLATLKFEAKNAIEGQIQEIMQNQKEHQIE